MSLHAPIHLRHGAAPPLRGPRAAPFWRDVLEMTAAMVVGMCVLGVAFRFLHLVVFGTGFDAAWREHTALAVLAMTFNMTLPMVLLMRHRGHGGRSSAEMAGAMAALAVGLLGLFWAGFLSDRAVLPLEMALMLPVMVLVMAGGAGGTEPERAAAGTPGRG